ncbi:glycosyltransferase family 4 protein [Sodalinema gerasimenkoae]|uniref:glycosyltransferase family 4 protein n=1 Tax=Sodalinema gerasimenkoae TaxID=2862348 RepID=UPI00135AC14E|nr:glycosyltransferase family 4 protein [Sodalinema gerasimenkoae]
MRVAFTTMYDVGDRRSWPPTQLGLCQAGFAMAQTLQNLGCQVDYVGGLSKKRSLVTKLKWEFYNKVQQRDYYRWVEPGIVRDYGLQVQEKLGQIDYDIILAAENVLPIATLKPQKPMVLWTDAPLSALVDYYPYMSHLCRETRRNVYSFEKQALDRCDKVIYASDWAANQAISTYKLPLSKVEVIPWGANWSEMPDEGEIRGAIAQRSQTTCELLWVGVDWERKGGNIALAVTEWLNQHGLETQLNVAGMIPEKILDESPHLRYFDYLNKDNPQQYQQLKQLFLNSHFFVLPVQAESYGHVFCEAQGFGLPCLTHDTGGISTIVKHEETGWIFPKNTSTQIYGSLILEMFKDAKNYKKTAIKSLKNYQKKLNWDSACQSLLNILKSL